MVQRSPLAIALAVAIVAFHALTNLQVRNLRLTDISDGRMTTSDDRVILLAEPVRDRLARWLGRRPVSPPRLSEKIGFWPKSVPPAATPADSPTCSD